MSSNNLLDYQMLVKRTLDQEVETLIARTLNCYPETSPEDWEICYGPHHTQFGATRIWVQRKDKRTT